MWIIQSRLYTSQKRGQNKGFCQLGIGYTHKIKELSTSYKQNVDNSVKNICIYCESMWVIYFFKKTKNYLTLWRFFNIIEAMFYEQLKILEQGGGLTS